MNTRTLQALVVSLATLAGFVDALGYQALGGVFVSFMSGNSTVLGIAGAAGVSRVWLAAGVVASFMVGVMLGTWCGRPFGERRAPVVLAVVAAMLAVAALTAAAGFTMASGVLIALAMGAENTTLQRDGQPGIAITYMTGAVVRMAQRMAEALTGGSWAVVLADAAPWLGMVAGAFLGAAVFSVMELAGLWIAALAAAVLAGLARHWMADTPQSRRIG